MYKLFYCCSDSIDITTYKKLEKYLPHARRQKACRYRNTGDKSNCVISYLLLMYGLYMEHGIVNPDIAATKEGKLYLVDYSRVHFNISHCSKGCICAVSDHAIGVDIQDIRPFSWSIAKRCCTVAELQSLKESGDPATEFVKIWTMKESYLKMKGTGITVDLCTVDTTKIRDKIKTFEINDCYISVATAESFQEENICLT